MEGVAAAPDALDGDDFAKLGDELGISAATLRAWFRRRYPRSGNERRSRWHLTAEQVAAAQARWPTRPHPLPPRERPRLPLLALRAAHSRRRRPRSHAGRHGGAALVAVGLVAAALTGIAYTGAAAFRSSCDLASERQIRLGSDSLVYAANGSVLGMVPAVRLREPVELVQMSPWLPKATVAIDRCVSRGSPPARAVARHWAPLLSGVERRRTETRGSLLGP